MALLKPVWLYSNTSSSSSKPSWRPPINYSWADTTIWVTTWPACCYPDFFYFFKLSRSFGPRSREQTLRSIIVFSSDNVFPDFSIGASQILEHSNDLVQYYNWFPLCCAVCVRCVCARSVSALCVQPALDTCLRPIALFQVLCPYLHLSATIVYRRRRSAGISGALYLFVCVNRQSTPAQTVCKCAVLMLKDAVGPFYWFNKM